MGRQSAVASFTITAGAAQRVAAANPARVAIVFMGDCASDLAFGPLSDLTSNRGFRISGGAAPVILDRAVVGDVVAREWFAAAGGTVRAEVIEVYETPDSY